MLLDAREIPGGTTLAADVCVIGAGAAGITLARALAGSGHSVLLLESGGFEFDDRTQALYRGKTVGLPIDPTIDMGLDSPRLRYFGGTTNHWSGFCRPFPELDFEVRSYVPRSGWPIARADLDPYYAAAQDVVGLGPYDYSLAYWRDQGLIDQPLFEAPRTPHSIVQLTQRPRFGPVYHDEIVNSIDVQLVLWANVTRIALADDGNSVTGVDVTTLGKNQFTATAKAFVVATGGLEVPRLLLASNDRRPAGIGNEHDLVGRCFMEHVNISVGPVALSTTDRLSRALHPDVAHDRRRRRAARGRAPSRAARRPRGHAAPGAAGVRGHARIPVRARRQAAALDLPERDTGRRSPPRRGHRRADRGFGAGAL